MFDTFIVAQRIAPVFPLSVAGYLMSALTLDKTNPICVKALFSANSQPSAQTARADPALVYSPLQTGWGRLESVRSCTSAASGRMQVFFP